MKTLFLAAAATLLASGAAFAGSQGVNPGVPFPTTSIIPVPVPVGGTVSAPRPGVARTFVTVTYTVGTGTYTFTIAGE